MNIDYNAVIEILKSFLNNEKIEILGISVGEERQVKDAIRNLLTAYEKEKEKNEELSTIKETIKVLNDNKVQDDLYYVVARKDFLKNNYKEQLDYIGKDKLKEMLNGYKKALKDVEEAIGVLKSNLLIVEYEKHKKEIQKELTFREEDRISKISIINLLEDLLKEE